jgi:hypothetical protein
MRYGPTSGGAEWPKRSMRDFELLKAKRLVKECWRDRVTADQPPLARVGFEVFRFMNASHQQMREEIARLREENAMLRREVGARRRWIDRGDETRSSYLAVVAPRPRHAAILRSGGQCPRFCLVVLKARTPLI